MKLSAIHLLLATSILCVGCKGGDASSASNATAGEPTASENSANVTPGATAVASAGGDMAQSDKSTPSTSPSAKKSAGTSGAGSAKGALVGSWTTDTMQGGLFDFTSDGKLSVHGLDPAGDPIVMEATYLMEGDKIKVHGVSMHVTPGPKADATLKQKIADANAKEPELLKSMPDQISTIAWKDKNTIVLTDQKGNSAALKRKT